MSDIIPERTIDVLRTFNDLAVKIYGIDCTLYVPSNLTALESRDMDLSPSLITYTTYTNQQIWIEWAVEDIHRLRKLGIFAEAEAPIIGWFKNAPEVTIQSYVKVPVRYVPDSFDTDVFEVTDLLLKSTYNAEIYNAKKLAPRRVR